MTTQREQAVLKGVFEGLTNKEIGARLAISESSVKAVLQQLFEKIPACARAANWCALHWKKHSDEWLTNPTRAGKCQVNAGGQLWDAMVVGAGPAGCAAAYDLAAAGQSVLLLDKKDFPRAKACAGGLTSKAVQALRYSIEPVVRKVVGRIRLEGESPSSSPADAVLLKSREPICVMTVRAELDEYCLRKTIAAGACLEKIAGVRQIVRCGEQVHLLTPGQSYRARFLVGADGASGQVRRLCAAGSWFSQGFALEVQTAAPPEEVDLTFDFASVSHGYAWIFPKGDHLNVGVYSLSSAASLTRSRLLSYVKSRVGTDPVDCVTGQYLGIGAGESPAGYVLARFT